MITAPKSMREVIELHKTKTHEDFLRDPEIATICAVIGAFASNLNPGDVALCLAFIFGSICFDSEMQSALELPTAPVHTATFEERLELFGVHAKIGYEGVKAFAKETQPYSEGKKTN